jgi:hypothetical protein
MFRAGRTVTAACGDEVCEVMLSRVANAQKNIVSGEILTGDNFHT